jgi:hypothetical protein
MLWTVEKAAMGISSICKSQKFYFSRIASLIKKLIPDPAAGGAAGSGMREETPFFRGKTDSGEKPDPVLTTRRTL